MEINKKVIMMPVVIGIKIIKKDKKWSTGLPKWDKVPDKKQRMWK